MYLEKELNEIIKIPSVNLNIDELKNCLEYCINFVLDESNKNKIFVNRKEFNGVPSILISNIDTMKFDILSIGHIDVVPAKEEMFKPTFSDGKIYGRGSADMKSGVLVALDILKDVIKAGKNIKYGVLVVSDEEIGGNNGAKKWAELGLNSKILLDYDCGDGFEYISQKSKGVVSVEVEAIGVESHGSMPWEGLDANDIMFEIINDLRNTFKSYSIYNKPNDTWISTMHVGIINGGDAMNKIACSSKAVFDIRITEKYTVADIIKIFDGIALGGKYRGKISYKLLSEGKPVYTDENNKYFKKYIELVEKEIGKKPKLVIFNGTTDMRFFINKDNIIIHHNSNIGPVHSDNEWVDLKTLERLKKVGLEFVLAYKG